VSTDASPRIVAVAGAKGGTGKSLIAANIGIYLATLGKRVVLVDAALGSANLHTFIGVSQPQRSLAEVLSQGGVHLSEVAEPTHVPGLQLVAGERDPVWIANPRTAQIKRLTTQVAELEADFVVIDLGPGTSSIEVELFLLADVGMLITTPEPTAVELCYRFMRAAFLRRLRHAGLSEAAKLPSHEVHNFEGGIPSPIDLYHRAVDRDSELCERLEAEVSTFCPRLVINCARSKSDMDLGHSMASAGRRRLGVPIVYLGHCEYDEAVWVALRRKRPLLVEHPESRVAKCIEKLTRRIIGLDTPSPCLDVGRPESLYELMEVTPTASFEDLRRANRSIREVYGAESIVVNGLYSRERLGELHRRLDEAYNTLMDASKRKAYDQELFPDGMPSQTILGATSTVPDEVKPSPEELPPMPQLSPETEYTGTLLKQIRESTGTDLREISERTKIGMTYLQALEDETFEKLPAAVYVRGFLVEYCKIVNIKAERVLQTYLPRYRDHQSAAEDD
jgi:flagellar biosynthesis protein FlhG